MKKQEFGGKKKQKQNMEILYQRKVENGDQQVFSKLPIDVSFNILSRLPLKTISQCRWVCKTWYYVILHPHFAKIHFDRAFKNSLTSPCLLFRNSWRDVYIIDHQVFDNFELSTTTYNVIPKYFKDLLGLMGSILYILVGSVNGLVCLGPRFNGVFYIWNPITGEHIALPKSPVISLSHNKPEAYGFGFDSITGDYKVIQIINKPEFRGSKKLSVKFEVQIYTLGSDSWRLIENVPDFFNMLSSNVFVNGNLHWVSYLNGLKLVSFNLSTEEFNESELPPCFKISGETIVRGFAVLGEHLCVVDKCSRIWVMKDYGVHNSWTMEYTFKAINGYCYGDHDFIQLRNGEVLLVDRERRIGYYDPQMNSFKPIVVNNLEQSLGVIWQPILQVGSLLSPKIVGNQ